MVVSKKQPIVGIIKKWLFRFSWVRAFTFTAENVYSNKSSGNAEST